MQKQALSSLIRLFLHCFSQRMDIRCFLTVFSVKKMCRLNCYFHFVLNYVPFQVYLIFSSSFLIVLVS